MAQRVSLSMMPSGAACWEGEYGRVIIEAPRKALAGKGTKPAAKPVAEPAANPCENPVFTSPDCASAAFGPVPFAKAKGTAPRTHRVKTAASPLDWKRRWGVADDAAVLSGSDAPTHRHGRRCDGASAADAPCKGGLHFHPSFPACFRELYRSRDGRFVIFEDAEGHLTSVDSSRFA